MLPSWGMFRPTWPDTVVHRLGPVFQGLAFPEVSVDVQRKSKLGGYNEFPCLQGAISFASILKTSRAKPWSNTKTSSVTMYGVAKESMHYTGAANSTMSDL